MHQCIINQLYALTGCIDHAILLKTFKNNFRFLKTFFQIVKMTMYRVCVSGYFDPIHKGHIEYLMKAKELAGVDGKLVVIVNNDNQAFLKKGKSFMEEQERMLIVKSLRIVDEVHLSIDKDRTVCSTISVIEPRITHFVNGGDQNNDTIPERTICEKLGIELVDGLGDKIQSSSWLTGLRAK